MKSVNPRSVTYSVPVDYRQLDGISLPEVIRLFSLLITQHGDDARLYIDVDEGCEISVNGIRAETREEALERGKRERAALNARRRERRQRIAAEECRKAMDENLRREHYLRLRAEFEPAIL